MKVTHPPLLYHCCLAFLVDKFIKVPMCWTISVEAFGFDTRNALSDRSAILVSSPVNKLILWDHLKLILLSLLIIYETNLSFFTQSEAEESPEKSMKRGKTKKNYILYWLVCKVFSLMKNSWCCNNNKTGYKMA